LLTFGVDNFLKRIAGASRFIPAAIAAMLLPLASAQSGVVISQVYGGGGNSGATYTNDFIELFNPLSSAVTMTNWHIYYTSAAGTSWASNQTTFSGVIPAQGYFLIKEASQAAVGIALPTADARIGCW
jgi:predicted extracellular nuclease